MSHHHGGGTTNPGRKEGRKGMNGEPRWGENMCGTAYEYGYRGLGEFREGNGEEVGNFE